MSNINLREELLKLDKQALDNDTKYYDLCTLYESVNLSINSKKKLVEKINKQDSKAIYTLLCEAYEDDLVDFDDGEVHPRGKFIEDGREWTWIRQVGDTEHLDFDNWAVWMAFTPKDESNPGGPNDVAFFIVDVDTGFIDWGPEESVKAAREFLQSKVDDYNMDESISDDIRKNNLDYDDEIDAWFKDYGDTTVQFQDRETHTDNAKYPHAQPKTSTNTWGRVWKDGKLDKQFEGPKYKVRQDVARYLDKNEDLDTDENELTKNIERNADIDNELDQLYGAVCDKFGEDLADKLIVECGGPTYDENTAYWWTPELDETKLYSKFVMLFVDNMLNYEDFNDAEDAAGPVYDIIAKALNLPTTSDLDDPGYDYDAQKIWDKVRNKLNSIEIKEALTARQKISPKRYLYELADYIGEEIPMFTDPAAGGYRYNHDFSYYADDEKSKEYAQEKAQKWLDEHITACEKLGIKYLRPTIKSTYNWGKIIRASIVIPRYENLDKENKNEN